MPIAELGVDLSGERPGVDVRGSRSIGSATALEQERVVALGGVGDDDPLARVVLVVAERADGELVLAVAVGILRHLPHDVGLVVVLRTGEGLAQRLVHAHVQVDDPVAGRDHLAGELGLLHVALVGPLEQRDRREPPGLGVAERADPEAGPRLEERRQLAGDVEQADRRLDLLDDLVDVHPAVGLRGVVQVEAERRLDAAVDTGRDDERVELRADLDPAGHLELGHVLAAGVEVDQVEALEEHVARCAGVQAGVAREETARRASARHAWRRRRRSCRWPPARHRR